MKTYAKGFAEGIIAGLVMFAPVALYAFDLIGGK